MWILFSVLAGVFYTTQNLASRSVLKAGKDAWAFSFYFSLIGAATTLPFLWFSFDVPTTPWPWFLVGVMGLLIVLHNFLTFKATNYLEASVLGSITKFRLVWILLIGTVLLGEALSVAKVTGTFFTLLAGILVYYRFQKLELQTGIWLGFAATVVYGCLIWLVKTLLNDFSSVSLTFFIFAVPAVLNYLLMPQAFSRIKALALSDGTMVLLATFFGGLANLAINHAFSLGEASRVVVITEAFLVVVLVGEQVLLKERSRFVVKLLAVILSVLGAILIQV